MALFESSLPRVYENYLVPLLFEPYARDLASRLATRRGRRVLEIASGTGALTRELASRLPPEASIVATDVSLPMLLGASDIVTTPRAAWAQADAMQLPFLEAAFDVVVCQFGVMFFPDKAAAFAETRRVLRKGGAFLFNTWDRLEESEFADTARSAIASLFPKDPPRFLERLPHSYYEPEWIRRDLAAGGFAPQPEIVTLTLRSRAASARDAAIGLSQGSPMRGEIEARDPARLEEATDAAAEAIARRFGRGPVDGKMQAFVVTVER